MDLSFLKNSALAAAPSAEPHAFARFVLDARRYGPELVEEIALGQSLGAWEPAWADDPAALTRLVTKVLSVERQGDLIVAELAFPWSLWHGRLHWLMTLLYGKMSFFEGVQLADLQFSPDCFGPGRLQGPHVGINALRERSGAAPGQPLLMGILKPNVAMSDATIVRLYQEVAEAGVHLLKDDEIRFDADPGATARRVEAVARAKRQADLKTLYAVHLPVDAGAGLARSVRILEEAGADAFLFCPWTMGLGGLQELRALSALPILAHPALAGAFGITGNNSTIHPRVSLAQAVRAAGADLTLFPSPYGKLGLGPEVALAVAAAARDVERWPVLPAIPVPSAGIKPEHAPRARADFGTDFVLNAGTAIFAGPRKPAENVAAFRAALAP